MNIVKFLIIYISVAQLVLADNFNGHFFKLSRLKSQDKDHSRVIEYFNKFKSFNDLLKYSNDKFLKSYQTKINHKSPVRISKQEQSLLITDFTTGQSISIKINIYKSQIRINNKTLSLELFKNTQEAFESIQKILNKEVFSYIPQLINTAHAGVGLLLVLGAVAIGSYIFNYSRRSFCENRRDQHIINTNEVLSNCQSDISIISKFSKRKEELDTYLFLNKLKEVSKNSAYNESKSCIEDVKSEYSFMIWKSCLNDNKKNKYSATYICERLNKLSNCLTKFEEVSYKKSNIDGSQKISDQTQINNNYLSEKENMLPVLIKSSFEEKKSNVD